MGDKGLQKTLGLAAALSTVVGMVIGSGVFFKPQAVFGATVAPGLGMIAWVIGGILTVCGGLTAAELAAAIPRTGGMMTYIEEAYGDVWGFLTGWMQTVLFFPGTIAALAVIFATQVVVLLGMDVDRSFTTIIILAIITILFLSFLNTLGSKTAGGIQTVATAAKLIPLVMIIIFGFVNGNGSVDTRLFPITDPGVNTGTALGSALIATLFAYDGWINVGSIAGEMKNPAKDLPKAIVGGLTVVMAVYILINIAYLWVLPASELAATATPAAKVATAIFGQTGGTVITVGILISVFGALNGYTLTAGRVPYKLAVEGSFPGYKSLSKLSGSNVPANSIWFIAVLSCIYALSGQFNLLTDLTVFIVWIFYIMTFIGVTILRKKRPDLHRPYKVPLYPIVPLIAIIGGAYVVINTLLTQTTYAIAGLVVTAIGWPVYSTMKKKIRES